MTRLEQDILAGRIPPKGTPVVATKVTAWWGKGAKGIFVEVLPHGVGLNAHPEDRNFHWKQVGGTDDGNLWWADCKNLTGEGNGIEYANASSGFTHEDDG